MQYRHRTALSFYLGTAAATIVAAGALAQGSPAIESVVVTGSHIAGVAPVGSPVITVDQHTMDERGFTTLSSMLSDLPQVDSLGPTPTGLAGGTNVEHAGGNQTYATSINLRGIDPADTLNLIDGMRLVAESSNSIHDVNVVPSMMVQRIDVVADGGSATYGSDAITGTINVILKKPVGGVNILLEGNNDPGQWGHQEGISIGSTWDTPVLGGGGLLVALQYRHSDPLIESHRPAVYFQNLIPYIDPTNAAALAQALPSTSAAPGNATSTTANPLGKVGNIYAIPHGVGVGQGITLAQLGLASNPATPGVGGQPNYLDDNAFRNAAYAIPVNDRWNAGITFKQTLTDWLDFFATAYGQTSISVAQTGSNASTMIVPNTNPYSPCATAAAAALVGRTAPSQTNSQGLVCPATTPGQGLSVSVSLLPLLGANAGATSRHGDDRQYSWRAGFNFSLPYGWSGNVAELYAGDWSRGHDVNIDTTALNQVLGYFVTSTSNINSTALPTQSQLQSIAGTTPGTFFVYTKPQNVPFFNPFCDASVNGKSCADPTTLSYIQAATEQIATNNLAETLLNVNGPIYDLPGGTMKLALGAEYDNETFLNHRNTTNTQALAGTKIYTIDGVSRNYASYFEELYIPLVGGDFTLPGIQELDIDLAHRYTAYNIAGNTSNPKIGVNYMPFDGLKLRGSWGSSFRAPAISDTDVASGTSLGGGGLQSGFIGLVNTGNVSTANGIQATGGFPGLRPQTAITWNAGLNWAPLGWLEGLDLDFSYFNISMRKVIGSPERNAGNPGLVNQGIFDDELAFNPTFWGSRAKVSTFVQSLVPGLTHGAALTQAQYDQFINAFFTSPTSKWHNLTPPNTPVLYICDCETHNAGSLRMDGLDMVGNYTTDTDWGTASFGYTASYIFDLDQGLVAGAPMTPTLNKLTFPLRFQGRLHAGLQEGPWATTVGLNFKNGYRADPTTLQSGVLPQYYHIHSWTTFDASFSYNLDRDAGVMLHDTSLTLSISNILNQGPPLVLQGGEVNYDSTSASASGRIVTLTIRKTL